MCASARWFRAGKSTEIDAYDDSGPNAEHSGEQPDLAVDRAIGSDPGTAARGLAAPSLRAPILQRVQRDYGNRASQNLVTQVLQRQTSPSSDGKSPELDPIPSGGGQPLEERERASLEQHFQTGLGDVRVHTSPEAAESATGLDAVAYTSGRDIYFAAGMYAPSSDSGRRLLAHEVAHVVQQSSGKEPTIAAKSARGAKIGAPEDILETEADKKAEEFMSGSALDLTEEERKKREASAVTSGTPQRTVQRQQAQPQSPTAQSTTSLDATAQSIIRGAGDAKRDAGVRAVEAVWRIIHEYYPSEAAKVNVVTYDNKEAPTGLATGPYPAVNPTSGKIFVGDDFLRGVTDARAFAHRVLQVGHELEHINQFRDPAIGPSPAKKDEREFLAFYHEALASAAPHTGRFQHSTRIEVIDQALGYYDCLASAPEQDKKDAAKKYAAYQKILLDRRSAEIADMKKKGYANVPADVPPTGCRRQNMSTARP
ncbi:MAG TPA: DUF4157 domain-containing protein [Bryobacteraceae bacterium]|jgi:hypothetical protein